VSGPATGQVVEVRVGARRVLLALLKPSELLHAAQAAGETDELAVRRQGLLMALREVDGEPVQYDVLTERFAQLFPKAREVSGLVKAFSQVHEAAPAEVEALLAAAEVEDDGAGPERWRVRLPGGREVVLEAGSFDTLRDVLGAARSVRSPGARAWASLLDGLRRSVVEVDGAPAPAWTPRLWDERFTGKESALLGAAWMEMHAPPEVTVGEARPALGTSSRT
jgi:hypothetical protein